MVSRAHVAKNALLLTALRVGAPFVSLALVLAVSRLLGVEGLGRYTLVLTYLSVLVMVTPLGFNAFLMREGSRDLEQLPRLLGNAVVLTGSVALAAMVLMASVGTWLGYDGTTRAALALASVGVLPATLLVIFEAVFVSRQRVDLLAAGTVIDLLIRVGLAVGLLYLGYGILVVFASLLASQIVLTLFYVRLLKGIGVPLGLNIDRQVLRRLVAAAPTFLLLSVFATLYWRVDVLMLSLVGSLTDVGMYGAAYRFVELVKIVPQSLCLAVYPLVSQSALAEPERLKNLGNLVLRYLWAIAIPVAVGGTLLAEPILSFTVGSEFRPAAPTLIVLMWTTIPYAWMRYYAYVLVAANREHIDLRLNVVMSLVNVGLTLVLIPRYGSLGAAVATFVAVILFAAAQYWYLRRSLSQVLAGPPRLLKPLLASAMMGLGVWVLRDRQVLLVIAIGALIYLGILIASRFFERRELRVLGLDRLVPRVAIASE